MDILAEIESLNDGVDVCTHRTGRYARGSFFRCRHGGASLGGMTCRDDPGWGLAIENGVLKIGPALQIFDADIKCR